MISRCPSCAAQVDEESSRCPTCSWDFRERKRLPFAAKSEPSSHDERPAAQAASQEVPERFGAKIPELKFLPFSESVTESKPKRTPAGSEPPQTAVRRNPSP